MTTPPPPPQVAPANQDVDTLRRLRVLEERFMHLRRKAQLADDKLLSEEHKVGEELKALNREVADLRKSMVDMRETLTAVRGEMQHAASKHALRALEKYVGYWEPMQFMTKQEVLRISEEAPNHNLLKRANGHVTNGNTR